MNAKAEKFVEMTKENNITCFTVTELPDELETVVFRSTMEIDGQQLPVAVLIDKSIFVVVRTVILQKLPDKAGVQDSVEKYAAAANGNFKVFKYYLKENNFILDMCLPATDSSFDPDMVRALLDLAIKHLQEKYRELMRIVWSGD
ncbi:MAG: hypothetical protein LBO03_09140 [Acidaminococcales bacterium]|jgi:hypothetical protein|nr:hypothetical protein [Acidaminococcales bacterium]